MVERIITRRTELPELGPGASKPEKTELPELGPRKSARAWRMVANNQPQGRAECLRGGLLRLHRVSVRPRRQLPRWSREPDWSGTRKGLKKDALEVVNMVQIYFLAGTFLFPISKLSQHFSLWF